MLSKQSLGVKLDQNKRQWNLLPWREVGLVVDVLMFGANKYSPDNWKHVLYAEERYLEAAIRHIVARIHNRINDPESRKPHLAHAVCSLLFIMWLDNLKRRGHR